MRCIFNWHIADRSCKVHAVVDLDLAGIEIVNRRLNLPSNSFMFLVFAFKIVGWACEGHFDIDCGERRERTRYHVVVSHKTREYNKNMKAT